ncbi:MULTISPECIES: tetratricopeptide repeat protein [Thiorhodovibrio]|uniref:tetratricopeptide repeat protein n=1 Tax=Thiorhodovibrio TaxID=61593 RepID=UPI0019145859|nr:MULTISPECIES: tetratricopeptide repeat protein [Thiorhodovibrio]MBK5969612.1 hypothetical protein [Thiorhodovibrio winogradskyi]WPL14679.1 tetratricopeptide repeat protein [Thiorhodovibrio litoralis]
MANWNVKIKDADTEKEAQVDAETAVTTAPPASQRRQRRHPLKAALDEAQQLVEDDRLDDAFAAYEAILEKDPNIAMAYVGLGKVHAKRGLDDEALEHYAGALHIRKDFLPALLHSAYAYLRLGEDQKALENFQEALKVNPSVSVARLSIARIHVRQGEFDQAINWLQQALAFNPQLDSARLALGEIYLKQDDPDAALAEVDKLKDATLESFNSLLHLAGLLFKLKQYHRASDACEKAVGIAPERAECHQFLGRCYVAEKQYQKAIQAFEKSSELDPAQVAAIFGIAQVKVKIGELDEAQRLLVNLTKGDKKLGIAHRMLGELYMRKDSWEDAAAEFRAAVLHSKWLVQKHQEFEQIAEETQNSHQEAQRYAALFAELVPYEDILGEEGSNEDDTSA